LPAKSESETSFPASFFKWNAGALSPIFSMFSSVVCRD
jgi:hypothetical protein